MKNSWLPYRDTRGMNGYASWRMPRKLKKQWREKIIVNLLRQIPNGVKWKLWWKPLVGWTVSVRKRRRIRRRGRFHEVQTAMWDMVR